ncbi:MAG TPA: DUF885 domain-containing protein [Gemmatimonadaceae bacterium]|nr:DUF885 domain-containing protein [Gemmatimonadaceae bacterium]
MAASACTSPREPQRDAPAIAARVDSLADRYFDTRLVLYPEIGTEEGLPNAEHGRIRDNSLTGVRAAQARMDTLYAAVSAIDKAPLEGLPQEVTYAVLREGLESERAQRICRFELWGVASYVNGWQAQYTDLALLQPVGTDTLRALALARAHALPRYIENEIANLREGLGLGYSSPKVIVRNVISQLDGILAAPATRSPFYSPAERDSTPAFRTDLARVIDTELDPVIRRYRDFLETEYLPKARDAIGVSSNPDGLACYRATIRGFATVDMAPDSVFSLGMAEMARIENEMRVVAERSFGGESLGTLLPKLRTDPRYTFRTSQEIIDTSSAVVARAKAAMGKWFGRVPRADVVIQPYPEFRQKAGAPGQYQTAPDDGSRPAIFLINPSEPTKKSRADAENAAMHEAIPGHHLQAAIAKERKDLHRLSRYAFNSGFGEGWALYAERLGDEMGLYSSDVGRMGMLSSEAFRAARMVIDAGIHAKGWTRQQSLEYLLAHTVLPPSVAGGEIDRYTSWPGQAPSYMIGRNEIMRLREQARAALGPRFDIRAFHDQVLEEGSVPLWLLRARIERWLARSRAGGDSATGRGSPTRAAMVRFATYLAWNSLTDVVTVGVIHPLLFAEPLTVAVAAPGSNAPDGGVSGMLHETALFAVPHATGRLLAEA